MRDPIEDATYKDWVTGYCEEQGWYWEPQAPQMPHMNNLGLAVFPCMFKMHSNLLKQYSNKMAPAEEIWRTANSVWISLESPKIVRGFVLAYRIAKKVIQMNGVNTFLQTTFFHSDVCKDFAETAHGIKKKTRVID
jgi:hypothetical protein